MSIFYFLKTESQLKVRAQVQSLPAPPTLPQLRKTNCTPQIAPPEKSAQKFAWWAAMCYAGLVAKSQLKVRL